MLGQTNKKERYMDGRTRRGYARLLRDLQHLERSEQFLTARERANASIDALEDLIHRLGKLGNNTEGPEP